MQSDPITPVSKIEDQDISRSHSQYFKYFEINNNVSKNPHNPLEHTQTKSKSFEKPHYYIGFLENAANQQTNYCRGFFKFQNSHPILALRANHSCWPEKFSAFFDQSSAIKLKIRRCSIQS